MYPSGMSHFDIVLDKIIGVFKERGFFRVSVSPFEEYSLYLENKNFLNFDNIITFMGRDGRLMALKTDVTLSIIKNIEMSENSKSLKLFYVDQICRLAKETNEYMFIDQVGAEIIGDDDPLVSIEIIDTALMCLKAISDDFVLDLSHLGFIGALLDDMELKYTTKESIMKALHTKSIHTLDAVLSNENIDKKTKAGLKKLATIKGTFIESLDEVKEIVASKEMEKGYKELVWIGKYLESSSLIDHVNLDFSVVSDLNYYNGLIFKGYIKGVPTSILSGGRYDNLAKKMGLLSSALGFGLSLSEINRYVSKTNDDVVDVLLTYDSNSNFADVMTYAKELREKGNKVRLEHGDSAWMKCRERWHFFENGLKRRDVDA